MNLNNTWKLGLKIRKTIVGAQKIDGFIRKTFEIIIADSQVKDKINKADIFRKHFQ